MYNILIVGKTGEGKSEVIKQIIEGKKCFVFDLHNEYGPQTKYIGQEPINLSNNINDLRARHIECDFYKFAEQVESKKNTIVVFEEATGFLSGKVGAKFKRIMTNKLFTRNIYVFVFHSIVDIPPALMRLSDYIVLFKTNDERHYIEKKYPRLLPVFDKVKKLPHGQSIKIKLA